MQPDVQKMNAEIQGLKTISDRIRALDRAGYSRGDIARFLGKRYQQVRNVLVGDEQAGRSKKAPPANSRGAVSGDRPLSGSVRVTVGPSGEINLPTRLLQQLGSAPGDVLFARLEGGELHLLTPKAAMQRAQALVRQFVPPGVSLVDELLEERRREAERENRDG